MENLGDWLYFIVIAVIGLTSVLSGGKKKKAEEEARNQQGPPPDVVSPETASDRDFWDILTERAEELPPVVAKPKPRKQKVQAQTINTPPKSLFLEGESEIEQAIRKQGDSAIFKEIEEAEPLVTADDFRDPESLRKAVVYAEILNRKY